MSEELRNALGMTEGCPPPWLINMQRFGPPPSYPNLKIPGVNAPLSSSSKYGYGKNPLDDPGDPILGTNTVLKHSG